MGSISIISAVSYRIKFFTKINLTFGSKKYEEKFNNIIEQDIFKYLINEKTKNLKRLPINFSCICKEDNDNTYYIISSNRTLTFNWNREILIIEISEDPKEINFKENIKFFEYFILKTKLINIDINMDRVFFETNNKIFKYNKYFDNAMFEDNFKSDKFKMLNLVYY